MTGMTAISLFHELYEQINSVDVNTIGSIYKLCLSLVLGAAIGFERKSKGQSAGVRTFSLICMGATLAMLLSIYVPQEYLGLKNGDPGRIAAQVISGIGFLGAGAIIQMKGSVRGLTTAAGIWMVAIIGMAVGLGMFWLSVIATGLILFILVQLESWEHKVGRGSQSRTIRIKTAAIVTNVDQYRIVLEENGVHMTTFYIDYDYENNETRLNILILGREATNYIELFDKLCKIHPTKAISLANQINI